MSKQIKGRLVTAALLAALTACGGDTAPGTTSGTASGTTSGAADNAVTLASIFTSTTETTESTVRTRLSGKEPTSSATIEPAQAMASETGVSNITLAAKMTPAVASRLLAQASMGASMATIEEVSTTGIPEWIDAQFALPVTLHRSHVNEAIAALPAGTPAGEDQFYESFWKQVCTGRDQLRQRVAFGLSQIFVVSFQDDLLSVNGRMVASFYDVLNKHAFGNFRNLLQDVATHPAMGVYLTFLRNKKESDTRTPDENFARELMQLMTIGLYELNQDGTHKLSGGKPIETYTREDVMGLAKVFTGWSWAGPDTSDGRFYGRVVDPNRDWKPLQNYASFHSTSEKQVLGSPLPAGTAEEELKAALDRLFNHPNVGPFIGRQLIQRMVTSNPSPAYVSRVAAAFNDNGEGVRGDMKAVIKAILLAPEARNLSRSRSAGRVREPVLRMANWMRAFYASSASGNYRMWQSDDPVNGFGQTVMRAPSVFNFYRPSYTPPGSDLADADLFAPELQIASEPAVAGYLNRLQSMIEVGIGKGYDITTNYDRELALVGDPDKLLDRLNLLFMAGEMSPALRNQMRVAIESIRLFNETATNTESLHYQKIHRVYLAVFLAMASPEYIVHK